MDDDPYQIELPDVLEDSVAVEINKEIESLKMSLSILQDNYEVLMEEQERIEQADLMEQDGMELLKESYFTHLHNYTTSVYTLVNHSQRVVQKYGDDAFSDQYSDELKERNIHNKGAFLQQLRHYMQKRKLPPIEISVTYDDSERGYSTELYLKKEMMMSWDGWTSDAKDYLRSVDEKVPIREEIEGYQEEIDSFYDWLFQYMRLYFKEDFELTKKIVEQIEQHKEGKAMYQKEFVLPFESEDFDI